MSAVPSAAPNGAAKHAVEIRGLHKSFGDVEVLKGIDFTVEPGQVVCIIGPSGSGKSTLLRCVNLLERPTAGQVFVDGVELTDQGRAELDRFRAELSERFARHLASWTDAEVTAFAGQLSRLVSALAADVPQPRTAPSPNPWRSR